MSTKIKSPLVVRSGSAAVKIYRSRAGRPGEHFEVRYYSEGKLCRCYRRNLEEARAEARLAADKLAGSEFRRLSARSDMQGNLAKFRWKRNGLRHSFISERTMERQSDTVLVRVNVPSGQRTKISRTWPLAPNPK